MKKTPVWVWASPGSCTHVYRTGAWGAGGLKAPGIVNFEPHRFRNLYQIAHCERRWKSGITRFRLPAITSRHTFRSASGSLAIGGDAPRLLPRLKGLASAALFPVVLLVRQNGRPPAEASQSLKLRVSLLLVENGDGLRTVQPP